MGLDSLDDEDEKEGENSLESVRHPARAPKHIVKRESLPSVETSLDRFIEEANAQLAEPVDISGFQSRENKLQKELDELKQQLAAAERQAEVNKRSPLGKMLAAFVVGCASMFAVSFFMPKQAAAPQHTATQPGTTELPSRAPTLAPAPTPTPPAAAPSQVVATPIEEPAAPPPPAPPVVEQPAPTTAKADKAAKQSPPKRTTRPRDTAAASPSANEPQPRPPASGSGAGSDLYNPF